MRRLVRARTTRIAVSAASLVAVASCAIVLYPGASGGATKAEGADEPTPASSFQLLRDDASTTAPAELTQALTHAPAEFGLDPEGARRASDTGAWLIPGSGELCLAVDDAEGLGMSCASIGEALRGHLTFMERSTDGAPTTVIGAAPDGMTSAVAHDSDGGVLATAAIKENTYVVRAAGIDETILSR